MASPFKLFRKHQKVLLAWATIFLMFAFVLGGVLTSYTSPRPRGDNPLIVTSEHGSYYLSDLQRMVRMRRVVGSFLSAAAQARRQAEPEWFPTSTWWLRQPDDPRDVFYSMLRAKKAEALGMVVSNAEVNRFLREEVSGERVPDERLRGILSGFSVGNRSVSMGQLFDALREMLLAHRLREMHGLGMAVTPIQRWHHFLQLNERVKVELLPIPAEDFLDEVEDPSEQEVQAFFAEHRETLDEPDVVGGIPMQSPDPGFMIPKRAVFQYVVADYDKFQAAAAEEITDEQIREHYERRKDIDYVKVKLLDDGEKPQEKLQEKAGPKEAETEKRDPAEKPAAHEPPKEKKASTQDDGAGKQKPDEKSKPSGAERSPEKSESEKPPSGGEEDASGKPASEKPKAAEPKKKDEQKGESGQASLSQSPFHTVSFNQAAAEKDEQAGSEGSDSDAAGEEKEEPPADQPAKSNEDEPEKKSAPQEQEKQVDEKQKAQPRSERSAKTGEDSSAKPAEKPKEYIPFDEVKDEIRQQLAAQETAAKITAALEPVEELLERYSGKVTRAARAEGRRADADTTPELSDEIIEAIGAARLELVTTKLISESELAQMTIGPLEPQSERAGQPFAAFAFENELRPYNPYRLQDFAGNQYLVWEVGKIESRVPELEEVRDEVVRAWKMQKARDLALEEARRKAEAAEKNGAMLSAYFEGAEVIETDYFSWRTDDIVPRTEGRPRIHLTELEEVEGADEEFMRTVFNLQEDEVSAVMNHAKTVAYVVKPAGREASRDALRRRFLESEGGRFQPWLMLAQNEVVTSLSKSMTEALDEEFQVEWADDADEQLGFEPEEG